MSTSLWRNSCKRSRLDSIFAVAVPTEVIWGLPLDSCTWVEIATQSLTEQLSSCFVTAYRYSIERATPLSVLSENSSDISESGREGVMGFGGSSRLGVIPP